MFNVYRKKFFIFVPFIKYFFNIILPIFNSLIRFSINKSFRSVPKLFSVLSIIKSVCASEITLSVITSATTIKQIIISFFIMTSFFHKIKNLEKKRVLLGAWRRYSMRRANARSLEIGWAATTQDEVYFSNLFLAWQKTCPFPSYVTTKACSGTIQNFATSFTSHV